MTEESDVTALIDEELRSLLDESSEQISTDPLSSGLISDDASDGGDIRAKIAELSVAEKIKAALLGNATVRGLLVYSPLRIIALAVLKNPRIQIGEIVEFAKSKNISDHVLRAIASKKEWIADYSVKVAIVSNPRTPPDVGLKWVKFLRKGELKNLSRSREVSTAVATASRKLYGQMSK